MWRLITPRPSLSVLMTPIAVSDLRGLSPTTRFTRVVRDIEFVWAVIIAIWIRCNMPPISLSVSLSACLSVSVTSRCSIDFFCNFAPSAFSRVALRFFGRAFFQRLWGRFDRRRSDAAFRCQYCSNSQLLHKLITVPRPACERRSDVDAFPPHIPILLI